MRRAAFSLLFLASLTFCQALQNGAPAVHAAGTWMHYRGAWSSTVTYANMAVVTYKGANYVSLTGTNVGNTPSSESPYWALLGGGSAAGWTSNGNTTSTTQKVAIGTTVLPASAPVSARRLPNW